MRDIELKLEDRRMYERMNETLKYWIIKKRKGKILKKMNKYSNKTGTMKHPSKKKKKKKERKKEWEHKEGKNKYREQKEKKKEKKTKKERKGNFEKNPLRIKRK